MAGGFIVRYMAREQSIRMEWPLDLKPELILAEDAGDPRYSDGDDLEDSLLEIVQGDDAPARIEEMIRSGPPWPVLYHFSPIRENLLDWYPFRPEASLLEVGSGMGALTGLFCRKVKRVTAVELTARRATITAYRHHDRENLRVIAGNIDGIGSGEGYDYVTSIGVLEYAGRYDDTRDPFASFLMRLRSFLAPEGVLILAIENRFGLKYWSGAREDHSGEPYQSLEGYYRKDDVRTFSRKGLEALLMRAGFGGTEFYYPVPDFKLPQEIFSDTYPPTMDHNIRAGAFPYADHSQPREYLFNERLVSDSIISEDSFPFFANSFLVFATQRP
jgi:SAM-dependent methyltransferase